jgi:hypothetical protein
MSELFSAFGTCALVAGLYWINRKKVKGQYCMLAAAALFGSVAIAEGLVVLAAKDIICGLLAMEGIRKWSKRK